jgi:hypothetical protein
VEWIGWVIGGGGLVLAALGYLAARKERRRVRPVVIAHEHRNRTWEERLQSNDWDAEAWLTNESQAQAVNVRFGIELNGTRYPYKHEPKDQRGTRINAVAPGAREPRQDVYRIAISPYFSWAPGGNPDPGRLYWCRYESLSGEVWETRNPAARDADFSISRIRFLRLRERLEDRNRRRIDQVGERRLSDAAQEALGASEETRAREGD